MTPYCLALRAGAYLLRTFAIGSILWAGFVAFGFPYCITFAVGLYLVTSAADSLLDDARAEEGK